MGVRQAETMYALVMTDFRIRGNPIFYFRAAKNLGFNLQQS